MLVMVMTAQSLFERRKDVLVLRAFGFSRRATTILFITEITAIVGIASIVAYAIAHILTAVLNVTLFDFDTFVFDSMPLWIVACSLISVSLCAYFISLSLSRTPLRKLLSEK
jgi:predicted lysophospholipase L1 biosynthesis ABC-type transport system permease subunit